MSTVGTANSDNFHELVIQNQKPVLVEFWAEWCGPCRAVAPILEQIAAEKSDTISVVKVNIDENPDLANRYSVTSIPNMLIFRDGEEIGEIIGAQPKGVILDFLDGYLK